MNQKANNVNEFWASYREAVVGSGVPEAIAERYIRSLKWVSRAWQGQMAL